MTARGPEGGVGIIGARGKVRGLVVCVFMAQVVRRGDGDCTKVKGGTAG